MSKRFKSIFLVGMAVMFLQSCASVKSPLVGAWYSDVKAPVTATNSDAGSSKVGTAKATSILGVIATGDASIDAAAKSAGITKIHHIDEQSTNILGFYAEYIVYVYGE